MTRWMNPVCYGAVFAVLLAIGILVLLEVGRRIGARRLAVEGERRPKASGRSKARSSRCWV